ncbi:GNAT family N-acetyltransferase [Tsukamurella soli]|uniref:N-acetyltransferase domain-containing protein n=1 Tax=Tsukamurella soli TaxID=644556 RepID=A0ABP8JER9_9ACTN
MRFTDSPDHASDIDELRGHLRIDSLTRSAAVREALDRFGEDPHTVTEFAYAEDGAIAGGLVGTSAYGWLTIGAIWVREPRRGLGASLIARAETRARRAGCDGIIVRALDFQSPQFFQRVGFRPSGAVIGRPAGATEITLVKRITADPSGGVGGLDAGRDDASAVDDGALHPPKQESFDTVELVNVDPKGIARPVETFREEAFGLYLARPADHPRFGYLESWLLPAQHLRANIFHFRPGVERDQRVYLDVARIWRDGPVWHTEDWYLDLVEHPGRPIELTDVDELLDATVAGLLSPEDAETAIRVATEASSSITLHGHSVDAWLASIGAPITWRE